MAHVTGSSSSYFLAWSRVFQHFSHIQIKSKQLRSPPVHLHARRLPSLTITTGRREESSKKPATTNQLLPLTQRDTSGKQTLAGSCAHMRHFYLHETRQSSTLTLVVRFEVCYYGNALSIFFSQAQNSSSAKLFLTDFSIHLQMLARCDTDVKRSFTSQQWNKGVKEKHGVNSEPNVQRIKTKKNLKPRNLNL